MAYPDGSRRGPFERVLAVCSLLHEPAEGNSADRQYLGQVVLAHTLGRLSRCLGVAGTVVLCWNDQQGDCVRATRGTSTTVLSQGPRACIPQIEAVACAQRWSDGWRGGLMQTVPQDRGFFAPSLVSVARLAGADAVLLVDPSSALLDPELNDNLIIHACATPGHDVYFTPTAPGLVGLLVDRDLLAWLAAEKHAPGRLLHHRPDAAQLDPNAADYCCHGSPRVAQAMSDFRLDSDRKVRWAEAVLGPTMSAEQLSLCAEMSSRPAVPRQLVVELTTRRATRPAWLTESTPEDLPTARFPALLAEMAAASDDLRLTLRGRGDPLLSPDWIAIARQARMAGVKAIHVETDLLVEPQQLAELVRLVDVVSVHLPAMTRETYQQVMGVDGYAQATGNLAKLIALRDRLNRGTPIIVPTFIRCRQNLAESDAWYATWFSNAGSAALLDPEGFGNNLVQGVGPAPSGWVERREPTLCIRADGVLADERGGVLGTLGVISATRPQTPGGLRLAA